MWQIKAGIVTNGVTSISTSEAFSIVILRSFREQAILLKCDDKGLFEFQQLCMEKLVVPEWIMRKIRNNIRLVENG